MITARIRSACVLRQGMRRLIALVVIVAGCSSGEPAPSKEVTGAIVVGCFCSELVTERASEAQRNAGVPVSVWPSLPPVYECIRKDLRVDDKGAEQAWTEARVNGLLRGQNDGTKICAGVGYSVDQTAPEPASPARKIVCRMWAATPGREQSTAAMRRELITHHGVSQTVAEAALNRAAAESMKLGEGYCR